MKKIILFFILAFLFSCGTQKLPASLEMTEVNGTPVSGMQYIDDKIAIDWSYVMRSRLNFKLKNISAKNMRLIWDNAAYVDANGKVDRIMHHGIKYVDRNESQPSSTIPAGAILEDAIIPVGVIGYTARYGWHEGTMFGFSTTDRRLAETQKANTFGRNIKVLLPIEIDGEITEYTFSFTVNEPM